MDYLQKDSMLNYFNFMEDETSPIENMQIAKSLEELKDAVRTATDDACIKKLNINNNKLTSSFKEATSAVNDCNRNASVMYRAPINEFTRVHFIALPFINRMNNDLNQCSNGNNREACTIKFLAKYCEDDSCKVSSTM